MRQGIKKFGFGTAAFALMASAGCADVDVSDIAQVDHALSGQRPVKVLEPADMTNRSGHHYENNKWGLVSADTVKGWVDDWEENKPGHIKGKLFIMQMGDAFPGDADHTYVKHDDVNVFTFDRTDACNDVGFVRSDGVSEIPNAVFTGEYMDQAFMVYGIDPTEDMILLVLGPGSTKFLPGATRSWYQLNYWGIPAKQIAVMNGAAAHAWHPAIDDDVDSLDDMFVPSTSNFTFSGTKSIREVRRDGTSFQATLGDMMSLASGDQTGTLLVDARSPAEYGSPNGKASKTESKTCGASGTEQCYAGFEGHINGAVNMPYTNLLNLDDQTVDVTGDGVVDGDDASFTFRTVPELEAEFAAAGYDEGETIYTYCRTGARATVSAYAASTILGYPARMYDGSWIQWGKLANVMDKNGDYQLPGDSPWRTDVDTYSNVSKVRDLTDGSKDSNLYVEDHAPNAYANDAQAIIDADKAYKN